MSLVKPTLRSLMETERTAIAMAVSVSVTVSMGEETKGVLSEMLRVIRDSSETAEAVKSM